MVLMLFLWVAFYSVLAGGIGYGSYRIIKTALNKNVKRQHQLQGEQNKLLLSTELEEVCSFCDKPANPQRDIYDKKIGWYHAKCYKDLLK